MNVLLTALMLLLPIQPQGGAPTTFRVHGKVLGVPAEVPTGLFRATLAPTVSTPQGAIHVGIRPDGTFSFQVPRGIYTLVTSPPTAGAGLRRVEVVDQPSPRLAHWIFQPDPRGRLYYRR